MAASPKSKNKINKEMEVYNGNPQGHDYISSALDLSVNLVYIANQFSGINTDSVANLLQGMYYIQLGEKTNRIKFIKQ
jgi:hypothetical protein